MKADPRCPICSLQFDGHPIERYNEYHLYHCPNCDVVFSEPMKGVGEEFYEDPGEHYPESLRRIYVERKLQRKGWESLVHNARLFLQFKPALGGELLDIGCGEGLFLAFAQKYYNVVGIDIDQKAIHAAKELYGVQRVYAMTLEEFRRHFPREKFDVVTMFEVLEHLEDPVGTIRDIKAILKPRGILVISVPNRDRKSFERDKWDIFDYPPNHFTRWSGEALRRFLEREGFIVKKLYQWRKDWYGFYESEGIIIYRFNNLFERMVKRFQIEEKVEYQGQVWTIYKDSSASRWIKLFLRRISSLLWIPLWPFYWVTERPSYGLWAMALKGD